MNASAAATPLFANLPRGSHGSLQRLARADTSGHQDGAPAFTSTSTTARWPFWSAMNGGVAPAFSTAARGLRRIHHCRFTIRSRRDCCPPTLCGWHWGDIDNTSHPRRHARSRRCPRCRARPLRSYRANPSCGGRSRSSRPAERGRPKLSTLGHTLLPTLASPEPLPVRLRLLLGCPTATSATCGRTSPPQRGPRASPTASMTKLSHAALTLPMKPQLGSSRMSSRPA